MSVKGGGGVPPKSVTFFLAKILSVKGGGTPLTDKIRKVVFEVFPKVWTSADAINTFKDHICCHVLRCNEAKNLQMKGFLLPWGSV